MNTLDRKGHIGRTREVRKEESSCGNTLNAEQAHPHVASYNDWVDFTLRDADSRDFETLWRIDQQCFVQGIAYSRRELAAYMSLRGAFTIVLTDEESQILGFLVATTRRDGTGHVITIDVLPDARRLGIGSKLLSAAEERLRKLECHSVSLETAVDNRSALLFYKRHQYFTLKTVPRYYSNGVDALVLQKDLLSTAQAS